MRKNTYLGYMTHHAVHHSQQDRTTSLPLYLRQTAVRFMDIRGLEGNVRPSDW